MSVIDRPAPVATAAPPNTPPALESRLPARLVADLHGAFGEHHARAVHTKGTILRGRFVPSPEAARLCTATVFATEVPVVARVSDFTGLPDIPDNADAANPRGLACKFLSPDSAELDLVNHSFNGFPVARSEEFSQLLQAIAASGDGAPSPSPLDTFLGTHPAAKTFLTTQKPAPLSYATLPYFGVNAYRLSGPDGGTRAVRFRFVPDAGEAYLEAGDAAARGADYLQAEIAERVQDGPVAFRWYAQLAADGDALDDPSTAWPEERELVELGRMTLDGLDPDPAATDRWLLFLPGSGVPGIAAADPMLTVRNAAYPVSFAERR